VSWLNYAFRLMYLPIGLFGVSIATAALPTVSRHTTLQDSVAVRDTVTSSLSLMLMLNIPATVGLVVLAEPIVRVLLERGRFTAADTVATAAALQFYAIGLIGYSVVRIVSPIFYALGHNRTPVIVSIVVVLVNALLNYLLVHTSFGYRGLALGTSVAALINATTLLVLLRGHLRGLNEGRLLASIAKIAVASIAMGAAAIWSHQWLGGWMTGAGFVVQALRLTVAIGFALLVLAGGAWLLRIHEFNQGVALVTRRLRRPAR
jgi:putative peptidoglycan lipid II flippase